MTAYALRSPVTGVLFSGRYDSHIAAVLAGFDRFPGIAHLLDVVPVEDGGVDEDEVTDAALAILALPEHKGRLYSDCPGCEKLIHHSDVTQHCGPKGCAFLRRMVRASLWSERAP